MIKALWHHLHFVCRKNILVHHDGAKDMDRHLLDYFEDGPRVTLIPPDIRDWLDQHMPYRWQTRSMHENNLHRFMPFVNCYVFYRRQDAVLFKLTWGGKT